MQKDSEKEKTMRQESEQQQEESYCYRTNRASTAIQLHFLVLQKHPQLSHHSQELSTEYQTDWHLCLCGTVLEVLQQHGMSHDRPQ